MDGVLVLFGLAVIYWPVVVQLDRQHFGLPVWDGTFESLLVLPPTPTHPSQARHSAYEINPGHQVSSFLATAQGIGANSATSASSSPNYLWEALIIAIMVSLLLFGMFGVWLGATPERPANANNGPYYGDLMFLNTTTDDGSEKTSYVDAATQTPPDETKSVEPATSTNIEETTSVGADTITGSGKSPYVNSTVNIRDGFADERIIAALSKANDDMAARIASLEKINSDQIAGIAGLKKDNSDHVAEIAGLQRNNSDQAAKITSLEAKVKTLETNKRSLEIKNDSLATKNESLKESVAKQVQDIESLRRDLRSQGFIVDTLDKDVFKKDAKIANLEKEVASMNRTIDSLRQELDQKASTNYPPNTDIKGKEAKVASLERDVSSRDHTIGTLRQELRERESEAVAFKLDIKKKADKIDTLETETAHKDEQLGSQQTRISILELDTTAKDDEINFLRDDTDFKHQQNQSLEEKVVKLEGAMKQKTTMIGSLESDIVRKEQEVEMLQQRYNRKERDDKKKATKIETLEMDIARMKKQVAAMQEQQNPTNEENRSLRQSLGANIHKFSNFRQQIGRTVLTSHAWRGYYESFPHGHDIIPTSSEGLYCGLWAVIESIRAMGNHSISTPGISDLLAAFRSEQAQKRRVLFGMTNESNFSVEQVALSLSVWGETQNLNLRLGHVIEARDPQLILYEDDKEGDATRNIIWIHNDGNNLLSNDESLGHYSGMKPKEAAEDVDNSLVQVLQYYLKCRNLEIGQLAQLARDRKRQLTLFEDEVTIARLQVRFGIGEYSARWAWREGGFNVDGATDFILLNLDYINNAAVSNAAGVNGDEKGALANRVNQLQEQLQDAKEREAGYIKANEACKYNQAGEEKAGNEECNEGIQPGMPSGNDEAGGGGDDHGEEGTRKDNSTCEPDQPKDADDKPRDDVQGNDPDSDPKPIDTKNPGKPKDGFDRGETDAAKEPKEAGNIGKGEDATGSGGADVASPPEGPAYDEKTPCGEEGDASQEEKSGRKKRRRKKRTGRVRKDGDADGGPEGGVDAGGEAAKPDDEEDKEQKEQARRLAQSMRARKKNADALREGAGLEDK